MPSGYGKRSVKCGSAGGNCGRWLTAQARRAVVAIMRRLAVALYKVSVNGIPFNVQRLFAGPLATQARRTRATKAQESPRRPAFSPPPPSASVKGDGGEKACSRQ